MKQSEVTLGRFLRILLLLMVLAGSYFVLDSLSGVLLPFAIAWLLAYLIQPLVAFVQHRMRFKFRMLSIVASLLFIGAVIYGILMLVIPSMLAELLTLKNITLSFLNENLANSSIPEPVVAFFKSVAEENGLAAMLNSRELAEAELTGNALSVVLAQLTPFAAVYLATERAIARKIAGGHSKQK